MTVGDPAATHASGQFRKFVTEVQRAGDLPSPEETEELVRATVRALGNLISRGQADQLAPGLPDELGDELRQHGAGQARSAGRTEFLDQISGADRSGDLETVESRVRVVCTTLGRWAPPGEIDDTIAQLPDDLAALFRG